jgi:hypothetical protein
VIACPQRLASFHHTPHVITPAHDRVITRDQAATARGAHVQQGPQRATLVVAGQGAAPVRPSVRSDEAAGARCIQQRVPLNSLDAATQDTLQRLITTHIMSMRLTGDQVGNVKDGYDGGQSPPQVCARAARVALPRISSELAFANTDAAQTSASDSRRGCSVGDDASALKSPVMT